MAGDTEKSAARGNYLLITHLDHCPVIAGGVLSKDCTGDEDRNCNEPTLKAGKCGVATTEVCGSLLVVLVVNVVTDYTYDRTSGIGGCRVMTGTLLDGSHGTFEGATHGPLAIRVGGCHETA